MLNARAIYRLLIDDEQPVPPPDDPNQLDLNISTDDILDPKREIMRYAEQPFNVPGGSPTDLYPRLANKIGTKPRKKVANNTYAVRNGNNFAIKFHATDVVTAAPDGRVTVNSGGWKHGDGGIGYNPGWRTEPGTTTMSRMNDWLPSGWQIYKLKGQWYWYNRNHPQRHWESDTKYPYTDGDSITAEGALQMQAHPLYINKRRRKKV